LTTGVGVAVGTAVLVGATVSSPETHTHS